jgi:parallel beta-helix repeat protein
MNNRLSSIGIVCLLVTAGILGFIIFGPRVVNAAGIIIYVDDDNVLGPWIGTLTNPYNKIQDGVNASSPGDTVFVFNGTYYENVMLDKAINLTGENRDITIIDGGGGGFVVRIVVDWVNISGFTVTNKSGEGIELQHVQNCRIFNNNATSHLSNGIFLDYSNENIIYNNNLLENGNSGLNLYVSAYNIIANNTVSSNHQGIQISEYSNWNNIVGNSVSNSKISGITLLGSSNNDIINNLVTNNNFETLHYGGIEIFGSDSNRIINNNVSSNFANGVSLDDGISVHGPSTYNTISDNIISSNYGHGIHLQYWPNHNVISNNDISNNLQDGIYLEELETSYNDIRGNDVTSNINSGITIFTASNNNITDNNVSFNRNDGIYLYSTSNINIKNNIISNSINGIHFESSIDSIITGNDCSNNYRGIDLSDSRTNNIIDNDVFLNDDDGIYLESSRNNNIDDNNVFSNTGDGIHLNSSRNNTMTGNNVSINENGFTLNYSYNNTIIGNTVYLNSWYGVDIINKGNNTIYHNNFINNNGGGVQARDNMGTNHWNDSYPSGGNFWSDFDEPSEGAYDDYQGVDQNVLGSDGIVDNGTIAGGGKNPYVIDGDSQDNYPLIKFIKYLFLYEGWNLISIPFIQPDTNLDIVLNSIKGSYDAVQWYNVSDNSDPWKHSSIKKPSHLNDLDDIDHKMGFWIHITQPGGVLFQYSGVQPIKNQTITLYPGWNLVGYPSLTNKTRTAGLNNINFTTDIDSIWTYNAATKKWEELGPSDYFEVGRGYWVHSKVKKTWEVPL